MGQSIQEGCLPQSLLGPFFNTLSQVIVPLKILVLISINASIDCFRLQGLPLNSESQWKLRPLL